MSRTKKLMSLLLAAMMLLTMPLLNGIAHTVADDGAGEPETPSDGSVVLETEPLDPATLHVHKLGEDDGTDSEGLLPEDPFAPDEIVRVSIFLEDDSTVEHGFATRGIANNDSAKAYRKTLQQKQDTMQATIEQAIGHELTVKWNLTLLANAISVEIPYRDLAVIRRIPGVKSVEIENWYEAPQPVTADTNTANTSSNMVGAVNAWMRLGYTGAGSRVAIIDTGLDTNHQSMNAAAFQYAITQTGKTISLMEQINNDTLNQLNAKKKLTSLTAAQTYLNEKIPFAFNYVDGNTTVDHQHDTAGNHGSHVAGIAAANRFIQSGSGYKDAAENVGAVGMAPDAQILVMKVFGAAHAGAAESDYFAAIEDAIILGADAINLSLGSSSPGFTYSDSPYQETLNILVNNPVNDHMVVSISAGNSYAVDRFTSHKLYAEDVNFHTGGSPGSYINSLCVAAAQNTLTTGMPLIFDGSRKVFYAESTEDSDGNTYTNPAINTIAGTYNYVYIDANGTPEDFAAVNGANSLSGKIVIVNRGAFSFSEKGNNAISYSPKAVIIANNDDGSIHMDLSEYTGTFPMVSITLRDANAIKESRTPHTVNGITYYTGSVEVTSVEVSTITAREDAEITEFSSWGIPGSLLMKPEITAPGGDIYSLNGTSASPDDKDTGTDKYVSYSGTSMAAPHITGLAAVLMQYLRENEIANEDLTGTYDLRAITQSLLMSTATPMIVDDNYLSILQQGAGLVEVSKAIEAKSVIMMDKCSLTCDTFANDDGKVKVELGDDPDRTGLYDFGFTIYNISDKTLEFKLRTDLFTQAVVGDTLSHKTQLLPEGLVTYAWDGEESNVGHDVNRDGKTDEEDALAILKYLTGEIDGSALDLTVADLDGDETITSHDAHELLNWEPSASAEGFTLEPNAKAEVNVHIELTDAQISILRKEGGAYLEGFTYVTCTNATKEGESFEHEHSIPILGYYGSWTDASMFDTNSYTEQLYGNDQENYSGRSAESTNYLRITTGGTPVKFSGNPYIVEDLFPAGNLAIRSDAVINDVCYNLIRSAGGTGFAISKVDAEGNVTDIVYKTVTGQNVMGYYYSISEGAKNTATKLYPVNKALKDYGIGEGERVRVGFYAIPEYNAMMFSEDMTAADAGTLTEDKFNDILLDNVLGKGAFVGFDFKVDDTAPVISDAVLNGNTLSFNASDNLSLAYVAVLSLDGSVVYAEKAPGTDTYTVSFDAAEAIANAAGYVAVFAGDYAGNEAAVKIQVNNNTHVEKTVYELTDTVVAGSEYLIMSSNAAGTAYGLYYTLNASGSTATTAAYAVTIKAGNADTGNQPYIESSDVEATGVWTAGTGSSSGTSTFHNNGWYLRLSNSNSLTITKDSSRRDWTWDRSNNRLSIKTSTFATARYLRYDNNAFSVNTSTNSVYLYVKTTIPYDVDPDHVDSVTVTPNTLEIYKGSSMPLTAMVTPLTATDRSVAWTSSNTGIATVDDVGVVTGVAAGTATIRATSKADSTKYGECTVTVIAANKTLNGIIWDEKGNVYFSSFNSDTPSSWSKLHTDAVGQLLQSAFMQSSSTLYAASLDTGTMSSTLYTVNRSSYALTEVGENFVGMADAARGLSDSTYAGYAGMVYCFGPYLVAGNYTSRTVSLSDGSSFTGTGIPYGMADLQEDLGGYIAGVALKSAGSSTSTYYILDENGIIWLTTLSYSSSDGYVFSTPIKQFETEISTSFLYQTLYYDGTYLYWGHQEDDISELIIIRVSDGSIFRVGDFGPNIWPAVGFYTNGSVAPASVGDDDEIMSDDFGELQPLATRDELMTPEIQARFREEAQRMQRGRSGDAASAQEPVEEPAAIPETEPVEEPAEEPDVEASAAHSRAHLGGSTLRTIGGEHSVLPENEKQGCIDLSESEDSTNGLFTIDANEAMTVYHLSKLSVKDNPYIYMSINDDGNGHITVAYAAKDAIEAGTTIGSLLYNLPTDCTEIDVVTKERSDNTNLTEEVAIPINVGIAFFGESLILSGQIGVRFYMRLPQNLENVTYDKMVFTIDHDGANTQTVTYAQAARAAGLYGFTFYENSIQMADTITAVFHYQEGTVEKELTKTYTVKDYFDKFDAAYQEDPDQFTKEQIGVIESVADFGHYLQFFLSQTTPWEYGVDYAAMDQWYHDITEDDYTDAMESTEPYQIIKDNQCSDISNIGFSLLLDSKTSIRVYLTPADGFNGTFTSVTVDGKSATVTPKSGMYMIEIQNIAAHELSTTHTVVVTTANGTATITVSALSYVYRVFEVYQTDTVAKNAAVAICRYSLAADAYKQAQH